MDYIAYTRVSTDKQGIRGLGMEAQQTAINNFLRPDDKIIDCFSEIESGKNNDRPELLKAISKAKETGSTLLIAKLDRLSRNLKFICELMDSKVKFTACDLPGANEFTIQLMAALAQQERKLIGERTSAALQRLKAKGVKLGTNNLTYQARRKGYRIRKEKDQEFYRKAHEFILLYKEKGLNNTQIAKKLSQLKFKTTTGKKIEHYNINRILKIFAGEESETLENVNN